MGDRKEERRGWLKEQIVELDKRIVEAEKAQEYAETERLKAIRESLQDELDNL